MKSNKSKCGNGVTAETQNAETLDKSRLFKEM